MFNKLIADIFNEIAELLSVDDKASKFEVRAYQKAALTIGTLQEPIEDIYAKGGKDALQDLPGIGPTLADRIIEYIKTGRISKYDELKKKYPIDMKALTSIEGMGAKKAVILYKKLGVKDIADLKKAISSHEISRLEGFGERSEELLAKGVSMLEQSKGRMLLGDVLPIAERIVSALRKSGLVSNAVIAGSTRRMRETVGDIDILALSSKQESVMDLFTKMPDVSTIVSKGPTKTTVWLKIGISCDLRVIDPKSFSAALQYFTGSKDHNIEVRKIAIKKGYKLNEYGLFRGTASVNVRSEEDIYAKLGMQWMPPEMREDRGEVQLALAHKVPKLVELSDLKGDLHTHTKDTDGANTLEEMVSAAKAAGLGYIAVTNHTKSLRVAHGMDEKGFKEFFEKIDRLNESMSGFRVLKGAEVDIREDGSFDLTEKSLQSMDIVIGAVHSHFSMSESEMTARIVKAIDTGMMSILAHPTGRVILERDPYKVSLEKVFEAAERNNTVLEINSVPNRLDLSDTNIMLASKYRVMFAIDSDAHRTSHFEFLRYGVGTARRGWLTKDRVVNVQSIGKLYSVLKRG
ncbi:MAG: DNA polymerase/3'-5' exonuclease PolX [Candidatus Marsarchaeota archaeon]|jgi:DNA polymerase (family 10)|nr:DNA polymerase/3'-5' exonuclease PolX [Candidatus Marsarchaeota archaeon]MCL5418876.1 DNA polymerase/3'-5' exonuclease PolX [Candidatus Marsarchaeota archaeon]